MLKPANKFMKVELSMKMSTGPPGLITKNAATFTLPFLQEEQKNLLKLLMFQLYTLKMYVCIIEGHGHLCHINAKGHGH